MNLVKDAWLDFQLRDGTEQRLPLSAIVNPDVVDFALPRMDFQGAAYQFNIGLLQTVFAPEDLAQWLNFYQSPPSQTQLQTAFNQAAHAFNLTGEGPLFMQDLDPLEGVKNTPISGLLIEAPGGNTIKQNTDHFIKRSISEVISPEMAAIALFTLQINAPAGGVGHRVGLRGGGPLTTILQPTSPDQSLWQKLWINVMTRDYLGNEIPDLYSPKVFPWLGQTRVSQQSGSEVYARDVNKLFMYWAMPRRIRLEVENQPDICQLSGKETAQSVKVYRTQNYGENYSGQWYHPLTPYRWDAKKPHDEHLSIKGQPGGLSYKIWDYLVYSEDEYGQKTALNVAFYSQVLHELIGEKMDSPPQIWAFGYDMDNMKARCWYSASFPLFLVNKALKKNIILRIKELQTLSSRILRLCRDHIKSAWFSRPADVKGDFSFIDLAFYQRTEPAFFTAVQEIIASSFPESSLSSEQAKEWLWQLWDACFELFDEQALSEDDAPKQLADQIKSRIQLNKWLWNDNAVKTFMAKNEISLAQIEVGIDG
nr:type I-E CRISPR-associated protein Cse1/CasA [uncultured Moellerella sp.]